MAENFKIIVCPVCNTWDFRILYKNTLEEEEKEERVKQFTYSSNIKKTGQIVKCKKCGLIYANPQEGNIEKLYEESQDYIYDSSEEARKITFENDLKNIEEKGKLLDVGCSTGIFLDVAKERFDVYGVELSKWAYEKAKKITKNVWNNELKKCKFKNDFFDVVVMWDLIEHLTDPNKELKEINRILKKDGKLIISTPNINGFFSRLTGKNWWAMIRMHLFYFSPKTIKEILTKNGFEVTKIKSYPRTIILKYSIEWFKPYKHFYKILKMIAKTKLGDLKLKLNTGDTMVIYANKK
ncbi:MAG: class I SAM-dependent methyltransferase [Nanoarchaeota archaeon]|nr:class I SAM-dependent methyltransferase [Nanoarchaeota archaeon]